MKTVDTLEEAQAWCDHPSTKGDGWFDGYKDNNRVPSKKPCMFNALREVYPGA